MRKTLLLAGAVVLLFTACAKQPTTQSNLIGQKVLKQSEVDESVYYHIEKDFDFKHYNKIEVSKVDIAQLQNKSSNKKDEVVMNQALQDKIATYFTQSLEKASNQAASKNHGNKTLKLDVAIEKIDIGYEDLKFYNYIPIALAVKGITRGTGIEDKEASVVIAVRITDKTSNKVMALAVDSKKIENINNIEEITFEKVKPLLDEWTKKFEARVENKTNNKDKTL